MSQVKVDTLPLILAALKKGKAQSVLDVGCGRGRLSSALVQQGFSVTGLDPQAEIISAAMAAVPAARFDVGTAERMPYPDRSFDAVIFLNALHHVPAQSMPAALKEARRVLKENGSIIVVEPKAAGAFFTVMLPVEDETEIRALAESAISGAIENGLVSLKAKVVYDRISRFANADKFIAFLNEADPMRASAAAAEKATIERLFSEHAKRDGDTLTLVQPMTFFQLA